MTDHVIITGADGCVGTALMKLLREHDVRTTAMVHAADETDLSERAKKLSLAAGGPVECQPIELTEEVVITGGEGQPFKASAAGLSWCATAIDYYAGLPRHETGRIAGRTVPGQFHFSV